MDCASGGFRLPIDRGNSRRVRDPLITLDDCQEIAVTVDSTVEWIRN